MLAPVNLEKDTMESLESLFKAHVLSKKLDSFLTAIILQRNVCK
jgi:hypothetical protein